jgi:two-component system, chemotaxis family, protein-glutamate methylesterase/glutaminase
MSEAGRKVRVLVVDDSVVMRRILSEVISADPVLEVAAYAANGQIAISLLNQVAPDIVTLDVEMPVMNGLATLKAMRVAGHKLPVIMFSTLTERGAEATIDALALGASDYVAKPSGGGDYNAARERIREAVVPKIKALCRRLLPASPRSAVPTHRHTNAVHRLKSEPVKVLAIGCSTGGPNALAEILPAIPEDFPAPILIVQHMPPTFTRFLAQRLTTLCRMPVAEAIEGTVLCPGVMWVAPGGNHMLVERDQGTARMRINQSARENSCRPSVDVLFRSVAQVFHGSTLAVVLTGMGQDGLRGCEQLSSVGAEILVQDEATSIVWGMPGFVARGGFADAVLPLSSIGPHIVRRVADRQLFAKRLPNAAAVTR